MQLQTKLALEKESKNTINYHSKIVLLGSCFAENIAEKLAYYNFNSLVNPLGIIFHPKAIATFIEQAILDYKFSEKDIFYNAEQWHCFNAHSKLNNSKKETLLNQLQNKSKQAKQWLLEATHISITLGTAWVYKHKAQNKIVANCHKLPQQEFTKEILSVEQVKDALNRIVTTIKNVNKNAQIIFTISPVRHLKDGCIENQKSKAHLIVALHEFLQQKATIKNASLYYFPAYEILLDELRDYRFYAEDMLHPNTTAIQYIWEKFETVWIASAAKKTMQSVAEIQKGLLHKPFHPESVQHQEFLQQLEAKKEALQKEYAHIQF